MPNRLKELDLTLSRPAILNFENTLIFLEMLIIYFKICFLFAYSFKEGILKFDFHLLTVLAATRKTIRKLNNSRSASIKQSLEFNVL